MEHNNILFIQLATILGLAVTAGYFTKLLKLPLVVAYLLAGVFLSSLQFFNLNIFQTIDILPEIGIAFVLFLVGMELDLSEIKSLGKAIIISSLGQIVISFAAGFLISSWLGYKSPESIYLGIGLSFTSTIVVIKLLVERKDVSSLYGKLSIGILLFEDLAAIAVLMMMAVGSSLSGVATSNWPYILLLFKGVVLLLLTLVISRFVLSQVFAAIAKSAELLFLASLAWCFIFVAASILLGFSVVIGAFLAGVALANSPFHYEIQGKIRPLRDFFITLFFIHLGTQVSFGHLAAALPLIILFTLFALLIKPVIILLLLSRFGFQKHTIFQTALNLTNISEFSLIIAMVGKELGVMSDVGLTAMALTGVLSLIVSSIVASASKGLYPKVAPYLDFLIRNRRNKNQLSDLLIMEDHAILIGAHLVGGEIIKFFKKEQIPFMVMDFNPQVVQKLVGQRINALYGDAGDPEVLEYLNLEKARLIISTADNIDDNLVLLAEMKRRKASAVSILRAHSITDAEILYQAGADYVLLPQIVTGDYIAQILHNHWPDTSYFKNRPEVELNKLARSHLAFE